MTEMGSRRDKVAYIILTWNSEKYIAACLDSIRECRQFDNQVYLIDNGSSDRTVSIAEEFCDGMFLHLVRLSENMGTTTSRNLALREIEDACDYICVLDSDTIVNEGAIATLVAALESNPEIGLVGPVMKDGAGQLQMSGRNLPTLGIKLLKAAPFSACQERGRVREEPDTPIKSGLQDVPYLLSACWMARWEVIREVGLLDERIFYAPEDVDYCVRVWLSGYRVVLCHNATIIHEYQRLSKKKLVSRMNLEHLKGLAYYFRKYHYLFCAPQVIEKRRKNMEHERKSE